MHQDGARPFGYTFGSERPAGDRNRASDLIEDPAEQAAIRDILETRAKGTTLFAIRAAICTCGLSITHQTVRAICARAGVRKRRYPEAEAVAAAAARRGKPPP